MLKHTLIAMPLVALMACAHAGEPGEMDHSLHHGGVMHSAEAPEPASAVAAIIGAQGEEIGSARFQQGPHGMLLRMEIAEGGLTPGWHGVHFHEKADCSDVGAFQLSGGHHGKAPGKHGLMNPGGPEAGDLPNVWAAADGSAGYEAFTVLTELAPALEGDGIAIVIHAGPDDHMSQPIGGAGARVACGVIVRTGPA